MSVSANGISIVTDLDGTSLCVIGLSFSLGCRADSAALTGGVTVNLIGLTISYGS